MRLIFTKDDKWLQKWDDYVYMHPKGSHLIYSDWLKSYTSYGFDYEVGLLIDGDIILGGFGVVIPKFLFFTFYIIPHGPIYNESKEQYLKDHLQKIYKRAKEIKACYVQFSLPISSNETIENYVYQKEIIDEIPDVYIKGKRFKYVYTSYGLNWVSTESYSSPDNFLEHLSPKVRRNIRMPYNKKAEVSFITDCNEIKKGYTVITKNSREANYSVREFKEFKPTILNLIEKKRAFFIICNVDNEIKAAAFFVRLGNYITNITGGVIRTKPDIKLGYMLQWEMIKKTFELNHLGYNISMGGSLGVQDFKSKFGAKAIHYEQTVYHAILNPFYFKLFTVINTYLKPYKAKVSKFLSFFKK